MQRGCDQTTDGLQPTHGAEYDDVANEPMSVMNVKHEFRTHREK